MSPTDARAVPGTGHVVGPRKAEGFLSCLLSRDHRLVRLRHGDLAAAGSSDRGLALVLSRCEIHLARQGMGSSGDVSAFVQEAEATVPAGGDDQYTGLLQGRHGVSHSRADPAPGHDFLDPVPVGIDGSQGRRNSSLPRSSPE